MVTSTIHPPSPVNMLGVTLFLRQAKFGGKPWIIHGNLWNRARSETNEIRFRKPCTESGQGMANSSGLAVQPSAPRNSVHGRRTPEREIRAFDTSLRSAVRIPSRILWNPKRRALL